jgi:hypothetical protein
LPIAQKVDQALVDSLSPEQREQFGAFLQKVVARQGARPQLQDAKLHGEMRS